MFTVPDGRGFGAIFERAVEAIFLADDDARFVRANPAAEKLTGRSSEELQAMTVFELTPAASREEGLAMWHTLTRQGTLSGDYTLTRTDGSLVEVEFQAVANIMPGIHLSVVRDVTARNQDARRLRRAVSLQDATARMSAAVDTTQVAKVILAAGQAALDAQAGHVVAIVEDGHWAEVVATAGLARDREESWAADFRADGLPLKLVDGRYRFSFDVPSLLLDVFRSGEPVHVEQMAQLSPLRTQSSFANLGGATVCLPLVVGGELVGGLFLFWKEKRSFGEDEAAFAATLAGLCAQALDRARLFTAERDARERAVASEKSILAYQTRLQGMAFDRVVVEERERRRLAVALHDGVTQFLALAKMKLDPVRQRLEGADRVTLDAASTLIAEAIAETRTLSFELSPPVLYDLGIKAALSWLGEKLEQDTGLRIEIVDDGNATSLDEVTAPIVFRTVRELLLNVVKHAHSPTAKVSFHDGGDHLEIVVEDAGTGFDPAETSSEAGFGLMSVREQIGRLGGAVEVTSSPREGTHVRVLVPNQAQAQA